MTTKIKIDLANGLVEVEGSEEFVRVVYDDFKEKVSAEPVTRQTPSPPPPPADQVERGNAPARSKPKANGKKRVTQLASPGAASKKSGLDDPKVLKDLDLINGPGGRLRTFYDQFDAKTNFERNLIFLYFLQYKMGLEGITQDHVYTCYWDIDGLKKPVALRQGLLDTDQKRKWIDAITDPENLKVSIRGKNHLEHDMPKKTAS